MGKTEKNPIETYFEWWLDDMKAAGYVIHWDRESEEFLLFPQFRMFRMNYFKTKEPEKEVYNLLQKDSYTYDYRVVWAPKAQHIFCNHSEWMDHNDPPVLIYEKTFFHASYSMEFNNHVSIIDIKPPSKAAQYGNLNSFATFPTKQKLLLWLHHVYVNKVIPIPMSGSGQTMALFPNTFTPRRYMLTDGGTQSRNIKGHIQTLDMYVKRREEYIARMDAMVKKVRQKTEKQGDLFNG